MRRHKVAPGGGIKRFRSTVPISGGTRGRSLRLRVSTYVDTIARINIRRTLSSLIRVPDATIIFRARFVGPNTKTSVLLSGSTATMVNKRNHGSGQKRKRTYIWYQTGNNVKILDTCSVNLILALLTFFSIKRIKLDKVYI